MAPSVERCDNRPRFDRGESPKKQSAGLRIGGADIEAHITADWLPARAAHDDFAELKAVLSLLEREPSAAPTRPPGRDQGTSRLSRFRRRRQSDPPTMR